MIIAKARLFYAIHASPGPPHAGIGRKRHAVGVYLPERQGCCGMPALAAGDLTTFDQLLANNLQRFEAGRFDVLVTSCATCAATIHELWPTMADARRRDAALVLAGRSMDIHQFLVREVGLAPLFIERGPMDPVTPVPEPPLRLTETVKGAG